jgi:predicted ABC-type ATPase
LLTTPESIDTIEILNPNRVAARLRREGDPNPDLSAARLVEAQLEAALEAKRSIGVETVLSTDKYMRRFRRAKELGFRVVLIFIYLREAMLHVGRVRYRTRMGGHDVPEDKIIARFERSIANFSTFARESDVAYVFDNSFIGGPDGGPRLAAEKFADGTWTAYPALSSAPHRLKSAILAMSILGPKE